RAADPLAFLLLRLLPSCHSGRLLLVGPPPLLLLLLARFLGAFCSFRVQPLALRLGLLPRFLLLALLPLALGSLLRLGALLLPAVFHRDVCLLQRLEDVCTESFDRDSDLGRLDVEMTEPLPVDILPAADDLEH